MRGHDEQAAHLFSYVSPEQRVPANHPLRAIREMTDRVLATLSRKFTRMYSDIGRPSIAPEKLLRALLLQVLYRSEEHTSELQSHSDLVCRLLLEKKKNKQKEN